MLHYFWLLYNLTYICRDSRDCPAGRKSRSVPALFVSRGTGSGTGTNFRGTVPRHKRDRDKNSRDCPVPSLAHPWRRHRWDPHGAGAPKYYSDLFHFLSLKLNLTLIRSDRNFVTKFFFGKILLCMTGFEIFRQMLVLIFENQHFLKWFFAIYKQKVQFQYKIFTFDGKSFSDPNSDT